MESKIEKLPWRSLTRAVLFAPRTFFDQAREPINYRTSVTYLAKTAFIVSLINTLVLTTIFFVVVASFASILAAFTVMFGIILTPLIAVAANIPPDKVPAAIESFAKNGALPIGMMSARLGAFLFGGYFGTIVISTCIQSAIAHGIARLFGCTGSFRATAAVYALGSAAWMLSVVPVVNVFAPIYGATLNIFGMRHFHSLSLAKATIAVAIAAAGPLIVILAWSLLRELF